MPFLPKSKMARQEALWGYALASPLLIGCAVFFYLGMVASFILGFTQWDVLTPPTWYGLGNYFYLFKDHVFRMALWNTTRYALLQVPLSLTIALALALALNQNIRFRNLYRLIYFLPALTMPVAISFVWKWIYAPGYGILNQLLSSLGLPNVRWLDDPHVAMYSIIIMGVWMSIGYAMIIFIAGLQNIPRIYYEAAIVDGANDWQKLSHITVPLLTPTILFNLITSVISSFQMFDFIYVMTSGGPSNSTRTVVYSLWEEGFRFFRMGRATAMGWILFMIILFLTIFQLRTQKRWVYYE
jgi:multiple sugar transport system permease protein